MQLKKETAWNMGNHTFNSSMHYVDVVHLDKGIMRCSLTKEQVADLMRKVYKTKFSETRTMLEVLFVHYSRK